MIAVGIRELKMRLSEYVRKASLGEEIMVTDRGREVASLVPVTRERRALKQLVDDGKARKPAGKPRGARGLSVKGKPLSETVIEDRR
ncbi:MAG: type II toxin-antitoxin system prevent-host-death family antitoxin [Deltaproteobacteria bacterium]|nr:MAG: type II toxin-antitoxin system prevent-host-death family antitoxin [Deltaproteobacteria bacterium]